MCVQPEQSPGRCQALPTYHMGVPTLDSCRGWRACVRGGGPMCGGLDPSLSSHHYWPADVCMHMVACLRLHAYGGLLMSACICEWFYSITVLHMHACAVCVCICHSLSPGWHQAYTQHKCPHLDPKWIRIQQTRETLRDSLDSTGHAESGLFNPRPTWVKFPKQDPQTHLETLTTAHAINSCLNLNTTPFKKQFTSKSQFDSF